MRMVASSRLTARARALAVLWVWWWASVAKGQNEEVVVAGGGGGVVETESPSMVLQNQEQQGTKNVTSAAFVITDGIVGEDWVMSAVDANVSSEFGYLTLTAQRFGYLNLRLKKDAGPLVGAMYTHVCLDLAVAENPNQPAPPQTTMTMTGHSGSPVSLGVAAHTVLQGNEALAPGASPSKFSIPLPDSIDVSWFEIRFEEMSVQGSVASVRSVSFCDGGGAGYDGYSQCLWKSEGGESNNNDNNEGGRDSLLSQSSSSGSGGGGSAATTMPFVEAVYLSGFGLSPRWHDRSYVGFFDYSYILPSGESAVKALVGPNGALSFATSATDSLPKLRAVKPDKMVVRLTQQIEWLTRQFSNNTPCFANASMFGVFTMSCPAQPRVSFRWSSAKKNTMLGRESFCAETKSLPTKTVKTKTTNVALNRKRTASIYLNS